MQKGWASTGPRRGERQQPFHDKCLWSQPSGCHCRDEGDRLPLLSRPHWPTQALFLLCGHFFRMRPSPSTLSIPLSQGQRLRFSLQPRRHVAPVRPRGSLSKVSNRENKIGVPSVCHGPGLHHGTRLPFTPTRLHAHTSHGPLRHLVACVRVRASCPVLPTDFQVSL